MGFRESQTSTEDILHEVCDERDAIRRERDRLRQKVEAAFREGYRYGYDAGELGASYYGNRSTLDADEAWDESDARTTLTEQATDD